MMWELSRESHLEAKLKENKPKYVKARKNLTDWKP